MADVTVPPVPPSTTTAPVTPAGANAAGQQQVRAAEVTLSPQVQGNNIQIQGTVVASDQAAQELRIATANGEIVLKTPIPLPPDTAVTVTLYQQKSQLVANVTPDRAVAPPATATTDFPDPIPTTIPVAQSAPIPDMTEGAVLTAIKLPADAPPLGATFAQALQVLDALGFANLRQIPGALALPPDIIKQLITAPQNLTLPQQQTVLAFLSKPASMDFIKNLLGPQKFAEIFNPAQTPALAQPETEDHLFGIAKAQLTTRIAQETAPPLPAVPGTIDMKPALADAPAAKPAAGWLTTLKGLLPLVENLGSANQPSQPAALQPRLIPEAIKTLNDMPQNMFQVTIIKTGDHPAPPLPGQLRGTITSFSPMGFPVLETPEGSFLLKGATPLQLGSLITVEAKPMSAEQVISSLQPYKPSTAPGALPSFDPLTATTWPALAESLTAISAAAPDAATDLRASLPAPAQKFAPATLFFLAALQSGAIENWIGDRGLQTLRAAGRKDLIDKLSGDFSKLSSQSKESLPGEWRGISMPLMHDEQISQMQFYVRHQQDQNDAKESADDGGPRRPVTRFILNFNLSRMGGMQIDGLMRKERLDVVLRTEEKLTESIRRDLMQRFAAGIGQTNLQGQISFQTRAENWVTVELPHTSKTA